MKKVFILALTLAVTLVLAKTSKPGQPKLEQASIIYSVGAERVIQATNEKAIISIASMTKLVTVLTVLESGQSLDDVVTVKGKEKSPRINTGLAMKRYDLVELAMVSSDNLAARSLIEHYPGGYQAGIDAMNTLAQKLGAKNTTLVEPTGLLAANKSTVEDIVRITRASATYPMFARFANQKQAEVQVERVGRARRVLQWVIGRTTNPFFNEVKPFEIQTFKTGFTSAAGWCLTMLVTYNNQQYVVVTAGNPTKQARKMQADQLIEQITNQQYRLNIVDNDKP